MNKNMSAKFVSKNANFMLVLKPGIPGSHITGQPAQHGIYVRFQGGTVDVNDQHIIDMLRNHSSFNVDYIEISDGATDPFEYNRSDIEPNHIIQEIKHGSVVASMGTKKAAKISPELTKFINDQAVDIAKKMLPEMMKEFLKSQADNSAKAVKEVSTTEEKEVTDTPIETKPKSTKTSSK